MTCPICASDTTVSYVVKDVDCIHRRRKCKSCKHVFFTSEIEMKTSHNDYLELYKEIKLKREKGRSKKWLITKK